MTNDARLWETRGGSYWKLYGVAATIYTLMMAAFVGLVLGFGDRSWLLLVEASLFYSLLGQSLIAILRPRKLWPYVLILAACSALLRFTALLPSLSMVEPMALARHIVEQGGISAISAFIAFNLSSRYVKEAS